MFHINLGSIYAVTFMNQPVYLGLYNIAIAKNIISITQFPAKKFPCLVSFQDSLTCNITFVTSMAFIFNQFNI